MRDGLPKVPIRCAHCGNVEEFPAEAKFRVIEREPCIQCGKLGKVVPYLYKRKQANNGKHSE